MCCDVLRLGIDALGELDVLRDVDHHRARPAAAGDVERLVQHARQIVDVLHQIIVLGAGPRDADRVAFLERVVADQVGRHLPGDARRAGSNPSARRSARSPHWSRRDPRSPARSRPCRSSAHSLRPRAPRPARGAPGCAATFVLLEQRVIDRQHRAAGIAEDVLDALVGERLDHHFGAGHFLASFVSLVIVRSIVLASPSGIKKGREGPARAPPHRGMAQPPRRCAFLRARAE